MAVGKKKPDKKNTDPPGTGHSLRDGAEEQLARVPKRSADLKGKSPEQLIYELQVYQIELETQAEELRRWKSALEESRDKYLELYDFAPTGYLTLNDTALITEVNLTLSALLGVKQDDIINHGLGRFIAPQDHEVWDRYFTKVRQHVKKQRCTLTLKRKDGTTFPARLEGVRLTGNSGTKSIRIAISDITDIWQIEALTDSEHKYRDIFENSTIGIAYTTPEGRGITANNTFARMFGYTDAVEFLRDAAIGKFYPVPEDRGVLLRILAENGEVRNFETRYLKLDGTSFWGTVTARTVRDPEGQVRHFEGTIVDITDRKMAEDALRQSELLFREVFDNADDAVFLLERTPGGPGKYLLVNDKAVRMLGYSKEELLEMSPRDIVPEEIAKKVMPDVIKRLLRDGHATFESVHRRKDGSIYPIEVSTHTFLYQGRDVDLSIVRDITDRKQAEEALQESEEILRDIIEKNPMSIQIVDKDGFTLKVNHAHTILFGAKPPSDFSIFIDLQNKHPALEKLIRLVKSGEVVSLPDMYFNVHDSYPEFPDVPVWVRTIIFPLNDKSDKPERFVFMHENITEPKKAEEALRESEEKYRALFAAESDAIFVVDRETGIIIDCNDAITPMYGYRKDEAIGQPNTAMSAEPDATRAATNEVKGLIPIRFHKRKDGSIFPVEITANIVSVKERDVIVAAVRDISERMRAEEALQRSVEKHRLLIDNSHDIIYTLDNEGLFTFVSSGWTRLLGHPVTDVVGKPFQQFIHPDDIARCLKSLQNVARTGQRQTGIEYRVQHSDGFWRWHTTNAVPLRDETGTIIGCEGSASDITERKLAEDALALASRKLALLSGITRHDINNQLTILQGYLGILKKRQPDPSLSGYFDKTATAAKRIEAMIQFTREYEKIGVHAPVWQDCRTLVETAAKDVTLGQIAVKNDLPAGTEVFADSLIIRVCYNLMDNAVRYGGKITTIRFSAEKQDGDHLIVCEDDGVGLAADEKEKIFEQGFGKNTGLGLALAREILSITGITIRETGKPGKGARFEMTVPRGAWRIAAEHEIPLKENR